MMMGSRNLRRALLGATAMAVLVGSANADIDIFFGIDTTGQPLYNRTNTGTPPTTLSAGGAEDRFVSFDFAVDATGSVSIANNAGTNTDPFLTLYSSSFDPANPLTNAVAADDDGGPVFSSLITSTLTAGATNVAVGTGFAGGNFGTSTLQFKSASANTLVLLSNLPALNTPTTITTGALQLGNGGTTGALGTGAVTNNGQLIFNRSDNVAFDNVVSGSGWVVQAGAGTLSLGGVNTYTGGTAFNGGVVLVDADTDLGAATAALSFNGGTLQLGANGVLLNKSSAAVTMVGAGTIDTNGFVTILDGNMTGSGTFSKTGAGVLDLGGNNNAFTGATNVVAGELIAFGGNAIGDTSAVTVSGGAGLNLQLAGSETIGSLAGAGDVNLGSVNLTTGGNDASTTFAGVISGTGGLTKVGTGTFTLAGGNTFTGPTTITAGALQLGNGGTTGALGTGAVTNNGQLIFNRSDNVAFDNVVSGSGWVVQAGAGTLSLGGVNTYTGGTAFNGGVVFVDATTDLGADSAALSFNGGTLQLGANGVLLNKSSAAVTMVGAGTIDTNGFVTILDGNMTGSGTFSKTGAGVLDLGGNNNAFTGATNVVAGELIAFGGNAIGDTSAVTVFGGATLTLVSAVSETIGSLAGAGDVNLGSATLTTGGNDSSTTYTGAINGTGALTKVGAGKFSTASLAYTGLTTVAGGELNTNGNIAGSVLINAGATLSGNTSITGSLTNLGTLSPGNSPGTTTVAGNYIGGGFITQEVQFNNATLPVNGTTHDFLNIGGNATGVTTLNVVGIAPSGSPVATTGNGIEVVRVGGTSAATAFRTSDRVLQGGFEYILTNVPDSSGTADGFFLQSAPREELSLNAVILSASRNHIRNTYLNAGGDVHEADWGTKLRAWISSMYQSTRAGADAGVRHKLTDWAVSAGVDYEVAPSFRVGLKGSYGNTDGDVWVRQGAMTVDGDTWSILGSAHYAMDGFYADLSAGYAATDWDVRRALNPGGLLGTFGVASNVDVDGMVGHLDAGYRFKTDSIFTLTVAGQVFYNDMDCGTNCLFAPGSVPQSVEDTSDWVGRLEAKLEAGYDEGKFRPWIAVNYTDALDGDGQTVRAGNAEVVSNTANALFGIDVGLQAELAEKLDLTVQAGVQQGLVDDVETYQVQVGLKYRW